jgi:hypothetical protein
VEYLRREFGKEIVSPRFGKTLPKNKKLTKREIISLMNLLFEKAVQAEWDEGAWVEWLRNLTALRGQLRRHQFHAVGRAEEIWGVAVFDPSRVRLLEVLDARELSAAEGGDVVGLKPLDWNALIRDVEEWLRCEGSLPDEPAFGSPRSPRVLDRVRGNLRRFRMACERA